MFNARILAFSFSFRTISKGSEKIERVSKLDCDNLHCLPALEIISKMEPRHTHKVNLHKILSRVLKTIQELEHLHYYCNMVARKG